MSAPIPPNTVPNIAGAIADLIRVSMVAGAEVFNGEPHERSVAGMMQYAVQLLTLVLQREPQPSEVELLIPVLPENPSQ